MASYVTPKKGVEFIFYVGLASQADTKLLQSNPTIAAGDFKVSIDGGTLNNPATLPAVTPASSKMVKVTLSTSEMNGDNITLVCSDAAGAEWCDLIVNIQTSARQIDDLAYPATSGRSLTVESDGMAHADLKEWLGSAPNALQTGRIDSYLGAVAAGVIAAASFAAGAFDAVWTVTTRLLTAGTNIVLAKGTGITGFTDLSAAQVNAEVVDALATDTYAEPGQEAPAATATLATKIGYLFKLLRNRVTQDATTLKVYGDDASTVDQKATVSDDGATFDRGELGTGP